MAFQQFTFPQVLADLELTCHDADSYGHVPEEAVSAEREASIRYAARLATAYDTEKARSGFMIAPVLLELHRRYPGTFALFSGAELVADVNRGLNGICDFLLADPISQHIVTTPIVSVVEAKNDRIRNGLGQCIATMFAAKLLNDAGKNPRRGIHGVVSTGTHWKFLKLTDSSLAMDAREYQLDALGKLFAILGSIVKSSRPPV